MRAEHQNMYTFATNVRILEFVSARNAEINEMSWENVFPAKRV